MSWNGQCVQNAIFSAGKSTSSLVGAFPANVTAGNLLVVAVSWYSALSPTVTITDSLGNIYTLVAASVAHPDASSGMAVYYCANCLGGANSVTFASASSIFKAMEVAEYPGTASTTLDTANATNGSSSSPASPSITPAGPQELLIGCLSSGSSVTEPSGTGPTPGWTNRVSQFSGSSSAVLIYLDQIYFGSSAVSFASTISSSVSWGCSIVAFKNMGPAAASGGPVGSNFRGGFSN